MIDQEAIVPTPSTRLDRIVGPHGRFVRSSNFVVIQMAIVAGGGLLFWLIAANRFPVADLGKAAGLVSITVFVNFLTSMGLPVTVTRFASGRSRDEQVTFSWCLWVTTVASLIGSAVVAVIASNGFAGSLLAEGRAVGFLLMFLAVNSYSFITLLDYRQLALGRHRVVFIRTLVVACGRVIAVIVIPWAVGPLWIWGAMVLPVPVALVAGAFFDRTGAGLTGFRRVPLHYRRIVHFTLTNWASLLLGQAPFFVLPLIVLANVSAVENANFYLVWTMCATAFLVPQITGRMLLQEAHDNERSLREQARFSLKFTIGIALVCLALTVPAMLMIERLYGQSYAEAAQILPLLMLALLPFAVTTTVLNVARAQERHGATIAISLSLAVCVLVPALLVAAGGLYGVSAAWLFGHTISAFLSLVVLERLTRKTTSAPRRPITVVGVILVVSAVALPFLMLGPIGAAVGLAAIAARRMAPAWLVPSVSAVLLFIAALATLLEGRLVASLGFAQDRPIASGAVGIAMGILGAWALLGLSDQAVAASTTPSEPEQAFSIRTAAIGERAAIVAAALLGAVIGWLLDPGLTSRASQLADQLNHGQLVRDATDNLEPLVPILVTVGPLTAQTLSAAALALIVGVVVRSLALFDRRETVIGLGLLVLTTFVVRDDLGNLVALALGLTAVSVALEADRWIQFGVAFCLMALGCLASTDLVLAALAVVVGTGFIVYRSSPLRLGTMTLLVAVAVALGFRTARWLDGGSMVDPLMAVDPLDALVLACTLILPLMSRCRRPNTIPVRDKGRGVDAMTAAARRSRSYATAILAAVCFGAALVNQPRTYFADARFEYAFEPERGIRQLGALWQSSSGLGRIAGAEQGPIPILTFWVLRSIGFAPELAQHLWHGLLLAVAALGAASVVAHFRPKWGIWHVAAGLAFAFNPLALGLFTNSLIFLASIVVAPWMQLAVLNAGKREQRWKWAATLTLCIAASLPTELPATLFNLAFLVPTALYVVYVERTSSQRSMVTFLAQTATLTALTIAFVVIRTIRSVGDLVSRLVLSEDPVLVSAVTSYSESVRGMGSWLAYFRFGSIVPRPQFAPLIELPLVVAATFVVPIAAVSFLIRSDWRHRFLFAALAPLSLVVVVGRYPFPLTPWGEIVSWLNDAAPATSAFRNTLKAGAPMVLALAVLFGGLVAHTVHHRRRRWQAALVALGWAGVLVASSIPVWTLNLYPSSRQLDGVPTYWYEAADWLNEQGADSTGRALILPGSTATTYRWGYVGDDIFTALLSVPYLRQGAFPASTAEAHSVLAALDRSVADPRYAVESQLDVLRRFGVRFVVLRNDLDWRTMQRPRPAELDAWRQSPELRRVATFGQLGAFTTDGSDDSSAASAERFIPPVEVYELQDWQPIVRAVPAAAPLLMSGDGEGWMSLANNGLVGGSRPIASTAGLSAEVLADRFGEGSPLLITDSNALRQIRATASGLSASSVLQSGTTGRGVYSLFPEKDQQTTSWIAGVKQVRSSVDSFSRPWFRAENAFDADPRTAWRSGGTRSVDPSLEIEFNEPRPVRQIRVEGEGTADGQFAAGEIVLASGRRYPFLVGGGPTLVTLDGEPTESIRFVITDAAGLPEVGITGITIDDLDLAERRQVPHDVEAAAADDAELSGAIEDADIGYVFAREIGAGERPVELVLRRRFSVIRAFDARLTGRMQLNDSDLDSPPPSERCGDRVLRLDGRDVPITVEPVDGSLEELTFVSCEAVRLESGWHDVGHGEDIAVDRLLVLPADFDVEDLKLPWPAPLNSSPERMSGVEVTVPPATVGRALSVVSGRAAHPGWEADSADGEQLASSTLDAQAAFSLQSERSVEGVSIRLGSQRSYDASILGMYAGLGLCVFLLLRRPNRPPSGSRDD